MVCSFLQGSKSSLDGKFVFETWRRSGPRLNWLGLRWKVLNVPALILCSFKSLKVLFRKLYLSGNKNKIIEHSHEGNIVDMQRKWKKTIRKRYNVVKIIKSCVSKRVRKTRNFLIEINIFYENHTVDGSLHIWVLNQLSKRWEHKRCRYHRQKLLMRDSRCLSHGTGLLLTSWYIFPIK